MSVASGVLPISVGDTNFLLQRMGKDCSPLQGFRELTQNAIESGAQNIVWAREDVASRQAGVAKLCVIDDGEGMSGEELVAYINHLSSSASLFG